MIGILYKTIKRNILCKSKAMSIKKNKN